MVREIPEGVKRKPRLTFVYVGVDRRHLTTGRWLKTYKLAGEPGSYVKEVARGIAKKRGAIAEFVE